MEDAPARPVRVDAPGCDCSGCADGTSVPVDVADQRTLALLCLGAIENASGYQVPRRRPVADRHRRVKYIGPVAVPAPGGFSVHPWWDQ